MVEPLGILVVILSVAFLVETLTEAVFSPLFEKIPGLAPYRWALAYIALAVGLAGAFIYGFDLISILSHYVTRIQAAVDPLGEYPTIEPNWFGEAITGLAIGKGSNYIHQFISKFFPSKEQTEPVTARADLRPKARYLDGSEQS